MVTEADVLEWLRVCFDPELPVNIVDMGLVHRIGIAVDHDTPGIETRYRIEAELIMRTPNEEREAMLLGQVKNRLAGIPQISRTDVIVLQEPAWTPERMSPAARRLLQVPMQNELVQIRL